jgi:hypothetical protein
MSTTARKALIASRPRPVERANTSLAMWGAMYDQQGGLGYKPHQAATLPVGSLLKGAVEVSVGYGQVVARMPDGNVYCWGLGAGNTLPLNVGPEKGWCGLWQYRQPGLESSLTAQKELEKEGHISLQIETKERELAFPVRPDGRKGLTGQVVYIAGHTVNHGGKTWKALVENCGIEPGSDPTVWTTAGVAQVAQFLNPITGQWYIDAFNIPAPAKPTLLKNVAQVSMMAARGAAVLKDGTIRQWGRITNLGAAGDNFDAAYGPKKRPLRPPPTRTSRFHGSVFAGTLSAPLSTGAPITTLPVAATGAPLVAGLPVVVTDGAGHSQTFTPSAPVAAEATSIPILSQTPNFAYPSGAAVTSRYVTHLENVGEEHHRIESQTANFGQVADIETLILIRQVAKLSETLSTGAAITTLPVTALFKALPSGTQVQLTDNKGHSQTWTLTAGAAKGATSLTVESQKPNWEYASGVEVDAMPVLPGMLPEKAQVVAIGAEQQIEGEGVVDGTLSAALPLGAAITALPITGLSQAMSRKAPLLVNDGAGHTQVFDTAVPVSIWAPGVRFLVGELVIEGGKTYESLKGTNEGHKPSTSPEWWKETTSIPVERTFPTFAFPPGSTVKAAVAYKNTRRRLEWVELNAAALLSYTGQIRAKKQPKEEEFWPVTEGPLQAAGWPVEPDTPEGVRFQKVAVGVKGGAAPFTLALTTTGEVMAWGSNGQGYMGNGSTTGGEHIQFVPDYVKNPAGTERLKNIVDIACGEAFCMALDNEGRVYVWGAVQRGIGGAAIDVAGTVNSALPILVPALPTTKGERPAELAAARETAFCRLENGKVLAWGCNEKGECGNGSVGGSENGTRWKSGKTYKAGNKVYYSGTNWTCSKEVTSSKPPSEDAEHWTAEGKPNQVAPAEVTGLTGVVKIACGRYHSAAVKSNGELLTWGFQAEGQIGNGALSDGSHPTPYKVNLEGQKALNVECGEWNTAAILEGTTGVKRPLTAQLVPIGEVGGEQAAKLRLEWHSTAGTSGWTLKVARSKSAAETVEVTALIERLEEELEGELETEEREELEEELALVEEAQAEAREHGVSYPLTVHEPSSGLLVAEWEPPSGVITPIVGYQAELKGPGGWEEDTIFTNGMFLSPYTF